MPDTGPRAPRIVLITGASSGIGAAVARRLARPGHALAITARRADRLADLAADLRTRGSSVLEIPADLADRAAPRAIVERVLDEWGGLDVLINNAGFGLPDLFRHCEPDDIARQIDVDLVAPLLLGRAALPAIAARKGIVINISSAITAMEVPFLGAYGAAKAGLSYWNDALRREIRHLGVRVCLVEPGPIRTEFHQALRNQLDAAAPDAAPEGPSVVNPPAWMTADVEDVAARVARLVDHPKRRVDVLRRMVWPWRALGALGRLVPPLGDALVNKVVREQDRRIASDPPSAGAGPRP